MKRSVLMLLLAALSGLLWAANDAAVLPSQGVTAAPLTSTSSFAITIPQMLSYQGKLTDSLGNSVPDGNYQLTFRLYTQETGGSPFWTEAQTIMVKNGLFSALLGAVNPISSIPDAGNLYLSLQVGTGSELTPRLRITSSAYAYLAERAENADLLQGNDTTALDSRYVNEGQVNSITSAMIVNGTIVRADVAANFKAPYSDTADYAKAAPAVDSARVAANAHKLQGKDTIALSNKFVDEGQANSITSGMIQNNAITSAKIADTNVTMAKIQRAGAATGQVLKWTGSAWAPRNDSIGQGDNAWVRGTPDSVLYTIRQLGIARGGSNNMLYGTYRYTHTNLGVACTTGTSGQNCDYCTVAGGYGNAASGAYATVGGGWYNTASGNRATVGGGYADTASGIYATVGGGERNIASGANATVAGGENNIASGDYATVAGGQNNTASDGGATVAGGRLNTASGYRAAVGGGFANTASGDYATVAGGYADTCAGTYGFACGYKTRVKATADYTFAFGENCSTSTLRAVVFYHSGGTTKLGVGVQNPTHNIDVQGGAYCNGTNWVNASSRRLKKDIRGFTPEELRAVLEELMRTQVVRYRYKSDESGEEHIGVIAEEAPELLATPERDGINTGDAIGFLLAAVQAVYEENKELRQELEALKTQLQKGR